VVLENYQTTTHVPEALHRLTEIYQAIGLVEEARKTAAILGHNFPGNAWYNDSYKIVEGAGKDAAQNKSKPWYWPF
jgi:outer membrane protein assembly factor BamD